MKFSKMLAAITQVLNQDSDTQVDVCMTSEMARRIELWTAMYEDNAPWVDRKKVKSAQLPAAIASEVARLVTLEMKSEITGGSSATYLNDQYQKSADKYPQIYGVRMCERRFDFKTVCYKNRSCDPVCTGRLFLPACF